MPAGVTPEMLNKMIDWLNPSQETALQKACLQRLTLIQGPPGTGKTKLLASIVAFMHSFRSDHILVCSFQNETADLLYEALEKVPFLSGTLVRIYALRMIHKIDKNPDTMKYMTNTYHKIF